MKRLGSGGEQEPLTNSEFVSGVFLDVSYLYIWITGCHFITNTFFFNIYQIKKYPFFLLKKKKKTFFLIILYRILSPQISWHDTNARGENINTYM